MKSPFLYFVLYCVASLAIIDAKPTSEHHNETERNEIDTAYKKDKSDTRALTWIGPFVKPFRGAVSAVDNVRKEIFISPGELFKDAGYVENMFNKYFDGCTLSGFTLTENDFATFKPSRKNITIYSLKFAPLEPGTYQFKYRCLKQGQGIEGAWTVHSLRPYPIRNNAFFEFVHNLTRYEVTDTTRIWDSKPVGIKRRMQPNSFLVYGLVDGFQHDTILEIRMHSRAEFKESLAAFMLRLQDQRTGNESGRRRRRESNSTKRDQIRLWIKDFEDTISNKQKLAKCVALQYGTSYLDLQDVHFGNNTQTTTFNAELPNRDTCKTLDLIAQRILDCPFKLLAYNLTCASGESRFGPKHFFNTTADPGSSRPHDSENTNDSTTAVVNSSTEADAPLPGSESTTSKDRYPAKITTNKPDAAHSTLPTSSSVTSGSPPTAPNPANINPAAAPSPSVTSPPMNSVSSPPQGRTPAESSSPNDSSPSVGPPASRSSTPSGVSGGIVSSTAKPLGGGFVAPAETSSQRTTMFRKDPESDGFPSSVSNKANGDSVAKKDSDKQTVAKWFNFGNDASAAAPSVADSGRWFSTALKYTGIFAAICVAICLTILAMASWHHHCCCRL